MKTTSRLLLIVLLSFTLVAAACGDDDDGGNSGDGGSETTEPSEAVENTQTQLAAIGCYDGPIDGLDGPDTAAAILRFQRAQGLEEDGVMGPDTEEALETAVAAGVQNCSADGE